MPVYEYYCEVYGYTDGAVRAKNKQEAKKKIMSEIEMEGLHPSGEIAIERVLKEDEHGYHFLRDN